MSLDLSLAVLVLLSAILHVGWNTALRISGDRYLTFGLILCSVSVVGIVLAVAAEPPAPASWPYLLASGAIHLAYFFFLILAYEHGELSFVYPLARGIVPLFVALIAVFAANEIPAPAGLMGIGLVSLGIGGLAFAGGVPRRAATKPLLYAAGTGLLIASYTVVDGLGIRVANSDLGYFAWHNILHAVPFVLGVLLWRRRSLVGFIEKNWKAGLIAGVAATLAYGIVLYALARGTMAYVAVLRETSVLFAALVGAGLLKEAFGPRRVAAAGLIVAGLVTMQLFG